MPGKIFETLGSKVLATDTDDTAWLLAKVLPSLFVALFLSFYLRRTVASIRKSEPGAVLMSWPGFLFLIASLRHSVLGIPVPSWRRFAEGNVSVYSASKSLFYWMKTWIPSGEIGGHLARVSADLAAAEEPPTQRKGTNGKKKQKNASITPSTTPTPPPISVVTAAVPKDKKRHSMPALANPPISPTKTPTSTSSDEGFSNVRRERTASQADVSECVKEPESPPPPPVHAKPVCMPMPVIIEEEKAVEAEAADALPSSDDGQTGTSSIDANVEKVESRFAQYFNSHPRPASTDSTTSSTSSASTGSTAISVPKSDKYRPPVPSHERCLSNAGNGEASGSPPGLSLRRTKSVAPVVAAPAPRSGSIGNPNPQQVNPNTTSSTAYRRPTGTFASKGYALTGESVFAARASPVDPNQAPLEKRTLNFFQQRLSISRESSPVASDSASSGANAASPSTATASAATQSREVYAPTGKRTNSLFPEAWSPWLPTGSFEEETDSVVPPGTLLRPAGIIGGSRPSTASPGPLVSSRKNSMPVQKQGQSLNGQQNDEFFSLFNVDLFTQRSNYQ